MPLLTGTAEPWPRTAGWLVPGGNCTQQQHAIVCRALLDDGIQERPLGSNRGTRIDAMTKRAGLPVPKDKKTGEGWWWCAIWAGAVLLDCESMVPAEYPATDRWLPYLVPTPTIGSAILYGVKGDAHHIGIVARLPDDNTDVAGLYRGKLELLMKRRAEMLTVEGNRGYAGSTNNGVAVDLGPPQRTDVLGFFHPRSA